MRHIDHLQAVTEAISTLQPVPECPFCEDLYARLTIAGPEKLTERLSAPGVTLDLPE